MDFVPEHDLKPGTKDSSIFDAVSKALKDKPNIAPPTTLDGTDE